MVTVLDNNYIRVLVDKLRDIKTESSQFARITNEISSFLVYESIKDRAVEEKEIEIWTGEKYKAKRIDESNLILVPILRAGMGMLEGARKVLRYPQISVMGMKRNEETLEPIWYYNKMDKCNPDSTAIIVDPMLATGGSMGATIDELKKNSCGEIIVLAIFGAPEGVEKLEKKYPDIKIYVASLETKLNEKGYILPGCGDAGDRIFNTQ